MNIVGIKQVTENEKQYTTGLKLANIVKIIK